MKHFVIVIALLSVLTLVGCSNQSTVAETSSDSTIDFSTLAPVDPDSLQAVRLPNSEELVYIEGISEENAAIIDSVLRQYEAVVDTDIDNVSTGTVDVYGDLQTGIMNWFNPKVDLVQIFRTTEHTLESDGKTAWLSVPLSQNLAELENPADVFYFKTDEELGGYRMSIGYYLLGFAHSGMADAFATD